MMARNIIVTVCATLLLLSFLILFTALPVFAAESSPPESGNILYQIWRAIAYPFEYLSGEIGKLFIGMAIWFLGIAGSLFDLLIKYTIVDFARTLNDTGLMPNIEKVWGAFRDIGNIVIIGMFVFVAISIILGLQTYGEKKMIARLLIVAILINFSLFFTKVIIDASHITANQFYKSITATTLQGTQTASVGNTQTIKISDAFMAKTGITSTFDTGKFIEKISANNGTPFVTIIAYTSFASLFIMTVAIIFLYGSFLLASRGILLIVLMITSSLAFASYLIPSLDGGKYGWKVWRDTLLKTAFMAPLLLLFIWASLFILQSGGAENQNTIGAFLSKPNDSDSWKPIWLLIISVGLLFTSIKMSQSLSSGITGFKLSATLPGLAAVSGALLGGWVGRRTFGVGAGYAQRGVEAIQKRAGRSNVPGARFFANQLNSLAGGFEKLQKADFNIANSRFGKKLASQAGLKGKLAGTTKYGGYAAIEKERAKTDAGRAKRESLGEDEIKKVVDSAVSAAKSSGDQEKIGAANQKEQADRLVEILGKEKEKMQQQYRQEITQLSQKVAQSRDPDAEQAARDAIRAKEREHQNALKAQDARISSARAESQAAIETLVPNIKKWSKEGAADRAADISSRRLLNRSSRALSRLPFIEGGKRSVREAEAARKQVGESKADAEEKRILTKLRDRLKEGDTAKEKDDNKSEDTGKK